MARSSEPRTERAPAPGQKKKSAPPPRRRRSAGRIIKITLLSLLGLVVVLAGGLLAAPLFISSDTYKAEIERKVFQSTGRKLTIRGDVSVTFYPVVGMSAADVIFANKPGATEAQMATLDELLLRVRLLPLFVGEVDVDKFILVNPVIHFEQTAAGPNWIFNSPLEDGGGAAAKKPTAAGKAVETVTKRLDPNARDACRSEKSTAQWLSDELGFGVKQIRFGEVGVRNGTVTWRGKDGVTTEAKGINVDIELPNIKKPIKVDGDLLWSGERVSVGLEVEDACQLVNGAETGGKVKVSTASGYLTLDLDGKLRKQANLVASGQAALDVPSVRKLAAWAGSPIRAGGDTFGPLNIAGHLKLEGATASFTKATVRFDKIKGAGNVFVDATGDLPYVKGDLTVGTLDLNPYVAGAATATPGEKGGKIDASALKAFNADLTFRAETVVFANETVKGGTMTVRIRGGVATIGLKNFGILGGAISGTIGVDGRRPGVGVNTNLAMSGLPIGPLMKRFSGKDTITGTGSGTARLRAYGTTSTQLANSLRGNGVFNVKNGALRGYNIAETVRAVKDVASIKSFDPGKLLAGIKAVGSARNASPKEKTDFSELRGAYALAGTRVDLSRIAMAAPLFRIKNGRGPVDFGRNAINLTLPGELVTSLKGQGGRELLKGLPLLVRVTGALNNPSISPGIDGSELAKRVLGGNAEGGVKGILKGVVGGKKKPGDILKGLKGILKN